MLLKNLGEKTMRGALISVLSSLCILGTAQAQVIESYGVRQCRSNVPVQQVYIKTRDGWVANQTAMFKRFIEVERRIAKQSYETPYLIKIEALLEQSFEKTNMERAEVIDCRTGETKEVFVGEEATDAYEDFYSNGTVVTPTMRKFNYNFKKPSFLFFKCKYTGNYKRHFIFSRDGDSLLAVGLNLRREAVASTPHNYRKSIIVPIDDKFIKSEKNDESQCVFAKLKTNSQSNQLIRLNIVNLADN